ncbi:DedA family protein [Tuwongella immobilis]|uniref:VTT domain-containing protein n=1 Tax=Tuwongella immobilis TaxID=692036 RepID=A0A6C2YQT3_9BACT|nr:DedA family protein [Tuwongella immobilis]VIP03355.1 SNARE-like domain protein OS=Succinatimonas hippei YIT 12066 GN=HMPREF9444_01513 PE=4 SV=1: SNARE_assoc [Tuwongella immobilis]VTS04082.1 SNARE-like domain protein OS=Succinatimonas hippei YIT 12066 GN=HMPREF9444_01513 PE=4 SV=1: SNARE_assoc [Tuwongella immobilis]
MNEAIITALWQYATVFALLVGAGFGLPMPEELPIAIGGGMVGHASEDPNSWLVWWIMLPLCMIGVVLADVTLYLSGRIWGVKLLEKQWVRKILPVDKQARIRRNFEQYGISILLAARLTPGVRTPVFMMAGVTGMPLHRFLLADGLYAIPGVTLIFTLGYFLGDRFVDAVRAVGQYKPLIIAVLLGVIIGYLLHSLLRRPMATGHPEDIPIIGKQVDSLMLRTDAKSPRPDDRSSAVRVEPVRAEPERPSQPPRNSP